MLLPNFMSDYTNYLLEHYKLRESHNQGTWLRRLYMQHSLIMWYCSKTCNDLHYSENNLYI